MAIQSDKSGFLVGELVKSSAELERGQDQLLSVQRDIRKEVRAISRALSVEVQRSTRESKPGAQAARLNQRSMRVETPSRYRARPTGRSAGILNIGSGTERAIESAERVAAQKTAEQEGKRRVAAAKASRATVRRKAAAAGAAERDSRGRFVSRAGDQGGESSHGGGLASGAISGLSGAVNRLSAAVGSADNIDPTVNALKEVTDVVAPLGRGMFSMFGRSAEAKKERWYNRIWKALKDKQNITVKGGGGGGGIGLFGGGAGGAGGGLFGAAGGLLGGLMRGGKGLLRRVPILGALLAGGDAMASIFGDGDRSTKYRQVGQAGGMFAGGLAGAKLGAVAGSFLGPIGTAIGGLVGGVGGAVLGEKFGEKVGEWTKGLVDADIPGKLHASWETATAYMGAAWDSLMVDAKASWSAITDKVSGWWDSAKSVADKIGGTLTAAGTAVNDWVKEKTGVDVAANAGAAWDATKSAAASAWDRTKGAAASAWNATKDFASENAPKLVPETVKRAAAAGAAAAAQAKAGYNEARGMPTDAPAPNGAIQAASRKAGHATGAAANWVLGKTSERYESGGKGAGTVSSGAGDRGGASYGTYQLASKTGTLNNFLKANPEYGKQLEGMTPGSPEFNAKWKQIAKDDPNFGNAQHQFIEATHYKPQMEKLKKDGIDLSGRGAAVQDAIWSTSVQFGGGTGLIGKALAGKNSAIMSDAEIVSAIQDYKIANNASLFKSSDARNQAGTLNRAHSEKQALLSLANAPTLPSVSGVNVASNAPIPSGTAASVPAATPERIPTTPEAQTGPTKLNSSAGAGRGTTMVRLPESIGQNVGDRSLAHIVTGGIGGA